MKKLIRQVIGVFLFISLSFPALFVFINFSDNGLIFKILEFLLAALAFIGLPILSEVKKTKFLSKEATGLFEDLKELN